MGSSTLHTWGHASFRSVSFVAWWQTSTALCASLNLIINLITAAAPGALRGVAVWRHQNKTHKHMIMTTLITVVPFSVCLYMQKEVALILLLIGISALPKTPGSRCAADTCAQLPSFALHALFFCLWPVRTVSSRIYLCFSANFRSSYVLTMTVSIASEMHIKALRQPNTTLQHVCVYSMVQAFCQVADQCSFGNIYIYIYR